MGLCTFAPELARRKVIVFSDNRGAECNVRKGTFSAWDQAQLVHVIWTLVRVSKSLFSCVREAAVSACQALVLDVHLWVERVASEDNIADLPSRESYDAMVALGAEWRPPVVSASCLDNAAMLSAQMRY